MSSLGLRTVFWSFAVSCVLASNGTSFAQKKYDSGASDTEIKIGNIMPYSGPASALSMIGKTEAAYFRMINARGGINGRKINFISYDDGFSPPKAVEQARKLIESDEVLLIFGSMGTASNAAIQKYVNMKRVPHLFVTTGASRFSNPKEFPWTMGWQPNYHAEGKIYASYILQERPNGKIGVLYQNDDLGRDTLQGLKDGLGEKVSMIVAQDSYEVTEPTIDSHVVKLKSMDVDVFINITTPKFAAQAIKKSADLGWKPLLIINNASSSLVHTIAPAGIDNSQGVLSATYLKDAGDPQWAGDPAIKTFEDFVEKYFTEGIKTDGFVMFGYSVARTMVEVLRRCGDDLTRENVMRQATSLANLEIDSLLPGIKINTSANSYTPVAMMQMMRVAGNRFNRFGPVISAEKSK